MNANEARELARGNLSGVVIDPIVTRLIGQIRKAAEQGRFSLTIDWSSLSGPSSYWVNTEEREATFQRLRDMGYKVTQHPDPDPGHPCSHPYDEVSWR